MIKGNKRIKEMSWKKKIVRVWELIERAKKRENKIINSISNTIMNVFFLVFLLAGFSLVNIRPIDRHEGY